VWWYRNEESVYNGTLTQQGLGDFKGHDPLLHLTCGAFVSGVGFRPKSKRMLVSQHLDTSFRFSVVTHVAQTTDSATFSQQLADTAKAVAAHEFGQLLTAHRGYWTEFWQRSYVHVSTPGDTIGELLTADIALGRYMDACAGRQHYPIDNDGFMYTWPGRDQIYKSDTWGTDLNNTGIGKTDTDWRYCPRPPSAVKRP
jgi:hypothetical protein